MPIVLDPANHYLEFVFFDTAEPDHFMANDILFFSYINPQAHMVIVGRTMLHNEPSMTISRTLINCRPGFRAKDTLRSYDFIKRVFGEQTDEPGIKFFELMTKDPVDTSPEQFALAMAKYAKLKIDVVDQISEMFSQVEYKKPPELLWLNCEAEEAEQKIIEASKTTPWLSFASDW